MSVSSAMVIELTQRLVMGGPPEQFIGRSSSREAEPLPESQRRELDVEIVTDAHVRSNRHLPVNLGFHRPIPLQLHTQGRQPKDDLSMLSGS